MRHFIPQSVAEHVVTHNVWHGMPYCIALVIAVHALIIFIAWYYTRTVNTKVNKPVSKHPLD